MTYALTHEEMCLTGLMLYNEPCIITTGPPYFLANLLALLIDSIYYLLVYKVFSFFFFTSHDQSFRITTFQRRYILLIEVREKRKKSFRGARYVELSVTPSQPFRYFFKIFNCRKGNGEWHEILLGSLVVIIKYI